MQKYCKRCMKPTSGSGAAVIAGPSAPRRRWAPRDADSEGGGDAEDAERAVELRRVEAGARGRPVLGRELDVAARGPLREQAEELVEVLPRLEAMQPARSDDREDRRGGLSMEVAP